MIQGSGSSGPRNCQCLRLRHLLSRIAIGTPQDQQGFQRTEPTLLPGSQLRVFILTQVAILLSSCVLLEAMRVQGRHQGASDVPWAYRMMRHQHKAHECRDLDEKNELLHILSFRHFWHRSCCREAICILLVLVQSDLLLFRHDGHQGLVQDSSDLCVMALAALHRLAIIPMASVLRLHQSSDCRNTLGHAMPDKHTAFYPSTIADVGASGQ